MVTLSLGTQIVKIDKGELVGYTKDGHEYIHQKGSPGWSSADTEMFPIIGPVNEANFAVQVPRGNAIQDQHGLLRQFGYELMSSSQTKASLKNCIRPAHQLKTQNFLTIQPNPG